MSGPPPADPAAVAGEAEEEEKGEHAALGDLVIAPAKAVEGERGGEGEGDELFEEVHEVAVNLLYALIALHLAGVVFETRRSGRGIVGSMLPGGNRRP